jgi:hypothetical protein
MAGRPSKKVARAAPRRGGKMVGPDFTGYDKWTGQDFNKFKYDAKHFYYENFQEADLLPEVWRWMKENKFTSLDIKRAKAATGLNAVGVWTAISCKLLHNGCPDYYKPEAEYWESLPGTGDRLAPMSEYIKTKVQAAVSSGSNLVVEEQTEEVVVPVVAKQNIQELMRERAGEAFGEVEGLADEFSLAGYPKEFPTKEKIVNFLKAQKVLPQHVNPYIKAWQELKAEYEEVKEGKGPQLKEGYSRLTRTQINNLIKFADQVIGDLQSYIALKQATKAPRKRKAIPVEKIVSKLKHIKVFKDAALKLDLVGLSPVKLHNCEEAWVYDTKKRKLHHYVADEYSKVLLVKGNALIGFDKKQSELKTLRRPAEQIKGVTGSKPAARKFFKEIKAVAASPNGRFNINMIILKAF